MPTQEHADRSEQALPLKATSAGGEPAPSPASPAALVSTIRAPVPEVLAFANYHLAIGFRPLFLFFDDPADHAADALEDRDGVRVFRCDRAHWARLLGEDRADLPFTEDHLWANATLAFELAREAGVPWLLPVDSDELAHLNHKPLPSFVAEIEQNVDVVVLPTLEGVPEQLSCELAHRDISLFRRRGHRLQRNLARILAGSAFHEGRYFRGHEAGKSLIRTSAPIWRVRSHRPDADPGHHLRITTARDASLLHFDGCTFEAWREKWTRQLSGKVAWTKQGSHRDRQLADFTRALAAGDMKPLHAWYEQLYMLAPRDQKRLSRLGLLQRIQLSPDLFRAPAVASP